MYTCRMETVQQNGRFTLFLVNSPLIYILFSLPNSQKYHFKPYNDINEISNFSAKKLDFTNCGFFVKVTCDLCNREKLRILSKFNTISFKWRFPLRNFAHL